MFQPTEQIRICRSPLTDAQDAADAAFDRLGDRLIASGFPPNARGMDPRRWAGIAHEVAPRELAEFVEACKEVKRLMEAS